jgi:Spy/CpxP family protein refolding chaperone
MNRTLLFTLIHVSAALISASCFAAEAQQAPGRAGGAPRAAGFQFGTRQTGSLVLLRRVGGVPKELSLTDEQEEKLDAVAKAGSEAMRARIALFESLAPAERQARMQEQREFMTKLTDEAEQKIAAILSPAQLQRLTEIRLQLEGPVAIAHPQVVEALGLSDDQRGQLKSVRDQASDEVEQMRQAALRSPPEEREAKSAELQKKIAEIATKMGQKYLEVLTPEQREKFERMKGAKFSPSPLRK